MKISAGFVWGHPDITKWDILAISKLQPENRRLAGGIGAQATVLRRGEVFFAKHAYYNAFGFVWHETVHITMLLVLFCAKHAYYHAFCVFLRKTCIAPCFWNFVCAKHAYLPRFSLYAIFDGVHSTMRLELCLCKTCIFTTRFAV